MQDELDENQNKTDEELKRLGFGFDECSLKWGASSRWSFSPQSA